MNGKQYMQGAWELEIAERLKNASPGEWRVELYQSKHHPEPKLYVCQPEGANQWGVCQILGQPDGEDPRVEADAALIANAPADLRMLLKLVEDLRAELAAEST